MSIRWAHRSQATGGVAQDSQTLAFDGSGNPVGSVAPRRPCCRLRGDRPTGTRLSGTDDADHESSESGARHSGRDPVLAASDGRQRPHHGTRTAAHCGSVGLAKAAADVRAGRLSFHPSLPELAARTEGDERSVRQSAWQEGSYARRSFSEESRAPRLLGCTPGATGAVLYRNWNVGLGPGACPAGGPLRPSQ